MSKDYYKKKCVNIIIITDRLIKMIKYILMDDIIVEDIAKAFYLYIWKDYDLPSSVVTDRETQFNNHF